MHSTAIEEIGPFTASLTIGDTQEMTLTEANSGPFWMSDEERISSKYDIIREGNVSRSRTKVELLKDLRRDGYDTTKRLYRSDKLVTFSN